MNGTMLKHSATPGSALADFCDLVASMKPGERLVLRHHDLCNATGYHYNGAWFSPADRVLGNILGSSRTHSYYHCPRTGDIIFVRHEKTDRRTYTDPDRREGA